MKRLRALVVDDEPEFAETIVERMRLRNIDAEMALDEDRALSLLKDKDFDVVVLDVVLQHCRGLELLKEIKKMNPHVAVILLSGRGSDSEIEEGKRRGAFDYLIKPIKIEQLIDKMKQAVEARGQGHGQ